MVDAYLAQLHLSGLAEENLQARVRGTTLMGISNQEGHLVLATGNKSELAVGYSTLYGDAVGAYAPLKDVPKTLVWELSRWRNAAAEAAGEVPPIPPSSIDKPPSAELRPGQLDTDSLPDYALLDDVLDDYVEQDRGASDLVAAGFDRRPGRARRHAHRPGRVQASPVPAGTEDLAQGVRSRPPAAHHQPVARRRRPSAALVTPAPPCRPPARGPSSRDSQPRSSSTSTAPCWSSSRIPDLVRATEGLILLLQSISSALGGALALISGRPLHDIDRVFGPWQPFAAGGHGAEVRGGAGPGCTDRTPTSCHRPAPTLTARSCSPARRLDRGQGIRLGAALPRGTPARGCRSRAGRACRGRVRTAPSRCSAGAYVQELRPAAFDKGLALDELMAQPPFVGPPPGGGRGRPHR